MLTPLCCEERGGDQERLSIREVAVMMKSSGGPLGTVQEVN